MEQWLYSNLMTIPASASTYKRDRSMQDRPWNRHQARTQTVSKEEKEGEKKEGVADKIVNGKNGVPVPSSKEGETAVEKGGPSSKVAELFSVGNSAVASRLDLATEDEKIGRLGLHQGSQPLSNPQLSQHNLIVGPIRLKKG